MTMMGSECVQCGKAIIPDELHLCKDFATVGQAEQHAAQLQRDQPKEEFDDAPFNDATPLALAPTTVETIMPVALSPGTGMRINRVVTDIQLPCELCGHYVVYRPVKHDCEIAE